MTLIPLKSFGQHAYRWAGCELPPLFCTVSQTAWDIAQNKLDQVELLEPHPLKSLCQLEEEKRLPSLEHVHSKVGCLHG